MQVGLQCEAILSGAAGEYEPPGTEDPCRRAATRGKCSFWVLQSAEGTGQDWRQAAVMLCGKARGGPGTHSLSEEGMVAVNCSRSWGLLSSTMP